MPSRQRYVVVGVLSLAVVLAAALAHGFEWLWVAQLSLEPLYPLGIQDLPLTTLVAYAVALGIAVFCLKYRPVAQLAYEVVEELSRVSWPSRAETVSATMVVVATVLICSAYLGVFDSFWLWLTDWILGVSKVKAG